MIGNNNLPDMSEQPPQSSYSEHLVIDIDDDKETIPIKNKPVQDPFQELSNFLTPAELEWIKHTTPADAIRERTFIEESSSQYVASSPMKRSSSLVVDPLFFSSPSSISSSFPTNIDIMDDDVIPLSTLGPTPNLKRLRRDDASASVGDIQTRSRGKTVTSLSTQNVPISSSRSIEANNTSKKGTLPALLGETILSCMSLVRGRNIIQAGERVLLKMGQPPKMKKKKGHHGRVVVHGKNDFKVIRVCRASNDSEIGKLDLDCTKFVYPLLSWKIVGSTNLVFLFCD